jgi:putative hydrolase
MRLIADTHIHTIASTHAYSTVQENIHAAAQKGLYAIAITDHGVLMPGAPGPWYFTCLRGLPRYVEGVLVLRGEETNIINAEGHTDLLPGDLNSLDWVVASIHPPVFGQYTICEDGTFRKTPSSKPASIEEVTNAWLNIAKNPHINVIGHSGTQEYVYDYEAVVKEFARNGKLVELNEATFSGRKSSVPNCKKIMELCKKHSVPIIVDSDAHFSTYIGEFPNSLRLLEELEFPEELVVNSSAERFEAYLREYTSVFRGK